MKLSTLFIFLIFLHLNPYAQSPDIQWAKAIGGSEWEEAFCVVATPDSGFIVAGYRSSTDGDCSSCEVGSGYLLLTKLNKFGEIDWLKCYGGTGGETARSIKPTVDGGYILVANTMSNDGDVTGNHGSIDYWVLKIDESGNIQWQKCFGGSETDQPHEIIETNDGGYIIAGESNSDDGDVAGHHGIDLNYDFWIVKISNSGELEWEKSLGGSDNEKCHSIYQTSEGSFICGGYSESDDGDLVFFHLSYDYWAVNLSADGSIIWQKTFGGTDSDFAYSTVNKSSNSHSLIVGDVHSDDEDISFYHGGVSDVWLVEIDSFGILKNEKTYGGSNTDWAESITGTSDSSFIICGGSVSFDDDVSDNNAMGGIWVLSIDSLGVLKWEKSLGGSNIEDSFEVIEAYDQGFIVVGYTMSNDGDVSGNHGGRDMWVIKLAKPCDQSIYYADIDNDSYGDPSYYIYSCNDTIGYVTNNIDCNDLDNLIHPGVEDLCNTVDDDCDGVMDEDALFLTWYLDFDSDGFGNLNIDSVSCFELVGYVFNTTDCNDENILINPDANELCNNVDDNCDTYIDEGLPFINYYLDADSDLFGNSEMDSLWCTILMGYVLDSTDCDDTNPDIYPSAEEILNGLDDDCDQMVDEFLSVNNFILNEVKIYPNPAENVLHIEYTGAEEITIQVLNSTGQIIYTTALFSTNTEINLLQYSSGVYLLKFISSQGESGIAFIKE